MTKRQTFEICGEIFTKKADLVVRLRGIVADYPDNTRLNDNDLAFVLAILDRHPNAESKIGCGVDSMVVLTNPVYRNNRGFYLNRHDGTGTDWSWNECLRATPHISKVIQAMRFLVEPQTIAFKRNFFGTKESVCELTGETIAFVGSHVDHVPPLTFAKLAADFFDEYGLNPADLLLRDEFGDNKYTVDLDDDSLSSRWIEYHRSRSVLRVVSRLGNLSHSKVMSGAVRR